TQANLDAGTVTNTATAHAKNPQGTTVDSSPAQATITRTTTGALTLAKSATPTTYATLGQTVTYSYTVTNTENVTLSTFTLTDDQINSSTAFSCGATSLAPGSSTRCTAPYVITQANLDAGSVTNTATAHGTNPQGGTVDSGPAQATITRTTTGALTLAKSASQAKNSKLGQTGTYSYKVTNTENVTLSTFTVTDDHINSNTAFSCGATSLAPGASTSCTAPYVITQANLDAGTVTNTATAHGTNPQGGTVDSAPAQATITRTTTGAL